MPICQRRVDARRRRALFQVDDGPGRFAQQPGQRQRCRRPAKNDQLKRTTPLRELLGSPVASLRVLTPHCERRACHEMVNAAVNGTRVSLS